MNIQHTYTLDPRRQELTHSYGTGPASKLEEGFRPYSYGRRALISDVDKYSQLPLSRQNTSPPRLGGQFQERPQFRTPISRPLKQLNLESQYTDNYVQDLAEKNSAYDHPYNLGLATTQGTTNPRHDYVPRSLPKVDSVLNGQRAAAPTGARSYFATYGPSRQDQLSLQLRQGSAEDLAARPIDGLDRGRHPQARGRRASALRQAGYDLIFEKDKADPSGASANAYSASIPASSELFNPILGFSEGALKKQMFRRELKEQYTRSQKSSYSRSRSKSKLARLLAKRKEAHENIEEGIVGQIRRFDSEHGSASPTTVALKQWLRKSAAGSPQRSGQRSLSHSQSQDDVRLLQREAQAYAAGVDNLGVIKLEDQSKGYKAPMSRLARQESFEELNDREQYVPRRGLTAARRADREHQKQQQRQHQQNQLGHAQQLAEEQSQEYNQQLEKANAYREILQQQIEEKRQKRQERKDREKEDEAHAMKQYSKFYRFGKGLPGGGNPVRDHLEGEEHDAPSVQNNLPQHHNAQQLIYGDQQHQFLFENNKVRPVFGTEDSQYLQSGADGPTMQETRHMRPTNNFEEITEDEFDRRERAKAEYRHALQQQITDMQALKETRKKKDLINEVKQEQKIYKQLYDMREDYIQEEIKKGNADVRTKVGRIDMLQPPSEGDALSMLDMLLEKKRDRSTSKSKSPDARQPAHASGSKASVPNYADRQQRSKSKSKLESMQQQMDNKSNYSGQKSHIMPYQSPSRMMDGAPQDYTDQLQGQLGDIRGSAESHVYDMSDQLSRLNRLQEELEHKYKQQQIDNLDLDRALLI